MPFSDERSDVDPSENDPPLDVDRGSPTDEILSLEPPARPAAVEWATRCTSRRDRGDKRCAAVPVPIPVQRRAYASPGPRPARIAELQQTRDDAADTRDPDAARKDHGDRGKHREDDPD